MSAGAVGVFTPQPVRMRPLTARRPLRLVGPHERVRPDHRARPHERVGSGDRARPDERVGSGDRVRPHERVGSAGLVRPASRVPAGKGAAAPSFQTIRLTRRGRLVITLMATVAVATLAVVLAAAVDAAAPVIDHATTVSAGQTLSEVAATQLPSLPIHNAVARIQLVNGLNTSQVHAGQLLLIPALR
jgi:hypothetical protein